MASVALIACALGLDGGCFSVLLWIAFGCVLILFLCVLFWLCFSFLCSDSSDSPVLIPFRAAPISIPWIGNNSRRRICTGMNDFFNAIMQDVLGWAMDKALDAIWSHWLAEWALGAGETLKGRLEARKRASVRARHARR